MPGFGWAGCPAAVRAQVDELLAGFHAALAGTLVGILSARLAELLLTRSRQPSPI